MQVHFGNIYDHIVIGMLEEYQIFNITKYQRLADTWQGYRIIDNNV
jgi:hypothetical protein